MIKDKYSIFRNVMFFATLFILTTNIVRAEVEEQPSLKKFYETLEENFKTSERKKMERAKLECYQHWRLFGEDASKCRNECEIEHLKRIICFLRKNSNIPEAFSEIECGDIIFAEV